MTTIATRARRAVIAAVLCGACAVPVWATEYIPRQAWPEIQRGIQVTQYAKLANVVNELDRSDAASIVVLYPGGEVGHNWAIEIRDWLVALGVPSRMIALRPGSGVPDAIGLRVAQEQPR